MKAKWMTLVFSLTLLSGCARSGRTTSSTTQTSSGTSSSVEPVSSSSIPDPEPMDKVLFLSTTEDEYTQFEAMKSYPSTVTIDHYSDITTFPYTLDDLKEYDEIILSDIDVSLLPHYEDFVTNIQKATETYGTSVFTFGNACPSDGTIQSAMDYDAFLPITLNHDEPIALCLLIDRSGSMDTDNRMTKATSAAKTIVDELEDDDYFSVVSFSDDAKTVVSAQNPTDRDTIRSAIGRIKAEGGTELGKGLKGAYEQIKDLEVNFKYIIVLTDGEPFDTEATLKKSLKNYAADNVITSIINIASTDNAALCKRLATAGGGSYYYAKTSSAVSTALQSAYSDYCHLSLVNQADTVVNVHADTTIASTLTEVPNISGYNICTAKDDSTVLMDVDYTIPAEEEGADPITASIPLCAYWKKGNGYVYSFSISLNHRWLTDFMADENINTFFADSFDKLYTRYYPFN